MDFLLKSLLIKTRDPKISYGFGGYCNLCTFSWFCSFFNSNRMKLPFPDVFVELLFIYASSFSPTPVSGPYPERISYRLTGMGAQKNTPKKQQVKLLGLTCLFVKTKFNKTNKDFNINYPYNSKCRKTIFSFNSSFD